jgi:5-formyltetrahydrofolate cyclo-ligase
MRYHRSMAEDDASGLQGEALREAKRAMRRRVLAARDALPEAVRAAASSMIAERFSRRADFQAAGAILVTLPFRNEWDTRVLVRAALQAGKTVAAPRVDDAKRMLELYAIADPERDVVSSAQGIPEPASRCLPVAYAQIDFVVVPGIAFDADGNRLGYGGGYYDRLLPLLPGAARVAGAFDLQIVPRVPVGPNDIPVDAVVTESREIPVTR